MTSDEYKLLLVISTSSNSDIGILVYINKNLTKTAKRFGLASIMQQCAGNGKPYHLSSFGSRGECYINLEFGETYTFDYEDIQICKPKKVEPNIETSLFNYDLNSTKKIFNE